MNREIGDSVRVELSDRSNDIKTVDPRAQLRRGAECRNRSVQRRPRHDDLHAPTVHIAVGPKHEIGFAVTRHIANGSRGQGWSGDYQVRQQTERVIGDLDEVLISKRTRGDGQRPTSARLEPIEHGQCVLLGVTTLRSEGAALVGVR